MRNCKNKAFINDIQGIRHYIDDYFGVHRSYEDAMLLFQCLMTWFEQLGIPTKPEKCVLPRQRIKILGWIWNSRQLRVELTVKKKKKILHLLFKLKKLRRTDKKEVERLVGLLQHVSMIIFPAKAFVRRFELLIYDPTRKYGQIIKLDRFLLEEVDWWIEILCKNKHVRASYDYLLKDPKQADLHIWTDAASTIGVGGKLGKLAFQVSWDKTIRDELIQGRTGWDIQSDELLGSLVALKLFAPQLTGKSVTIYNDNPGAAHAIISKAPRLHRQDLQFMIREIAKLSIEYNFYFWGVKVGGGE